MADGHTKLLSELRTGDAVYGTVRRDTYRHYVPTTVLAHWQTVKPAYRVTLEDGTQLIASGDHRFLTGRGWKHVAGAEHGADRRPHLTVGSKLMGVGAFAEPPKQLPRVPARLPVRHGPRRRASSVTTPTSAPTAVAATSARSDLP